MAARPDDDVLDPAGEIDLAARHIGLIAAVEPCAVKQFPRFGRIVEIARRGRRPAKLEPTLATFAQFTVHLIDDADFVTR